MDRYPDISPASTQTSSRYDESPRLIEYADMVHIVQLSVARELSIPHSLESESYEAFIAQHAEEDRRGIECEIGLHFDEALVRFVIGAVIASRRRALIIIADTSDGIDGGLPWEGLLEERLASAQSNNMLTNAKVYVERVDRSEQPPLTTSAIKI